MKFFVRIALVLLIGFLSFLMIIPLAQPTPLLISYSSNEQGSDHNDFLKEDCFSKLDLEGLDQCKQMILQGQSDSVTWNRLGHIYYNLKNYEESYLSFKYAISLDPNYAIAWANICAALSKLQNHEEALEACNESLNLSSGPDGSIEDKVLAWNNKAIALYALARYQDSIDALDEALSLNPDDFYARLNRTVILHILAHTNNHKNEDLKS